MISEACDQLFKELQISRSPLVSYFQPGITRQEIEDELKNQNVNLKIPEELYSLYQWKNGLYDEIANSKASGEVQLFTLAIFTSINIAIQNYKELESLGSPWSKGLFPLFDSFVGDFYLIDTNEGSATFKMIMFYSPSNPYIENVASVFDTLESCLTSVAECFRKKVYYYNPGSDYLEINSKLQRSIWERHNPRSEYYDLLRRG